MAIPPPPPGSQPLPGAPLVDLTGQNLAQWADHVQEVASHIRLPPLGATECPTSDIVSALNRGSILSALFWGRATMPMLSHPSSGSRPYNGLVDTPVISYMAMVSSTETTASNSTVGMTLLRPPTPGLPLLEPMDTSSYPTTEELLRMAGVGRGARGQTPLWTPAVDTHCPWPSSAWTKDASTTGAHPWEAGSHSSDSLPAAGVPTSSSCPQAGRHLQCLSEPGTGEAG